MRRRHRLILILLVLLVFTALPPQALAQQIELEIEVTQQSYLIFDGDRLPVVVNLENVGDSSLQDVMVRSSTGEVRAVGTLQPGVDREVTLYLENYSLGRNQAEIYATFSGGESPHRSIWFEVRPPSESITLRLISAPQSIYEGTVFTAQIQVQNLWQQAVSGVYIKSGSKVLYYVGALNPNQSLDIELQMEEYDIGSNTLELVAASERGTSPPLTLEFEVIPAESAVKVYLASLSPATYPTETLELSLVVAASENAGVTDLEIEALSPGVQPTGYYLGEQIAEEQEMPTVDVQSLLTGTSETEEEEPEKTVRGRELTFEVQEPEVGTQPLDFLVSYRIGNAVVQQEFSVDAHVIETPNVRLIQAEPILATKGAQAMVMLHVANDLPVEIDAVRVVPIGDIEIYPSEFFIGTMSPNDFLPASFRIDTSQLEDGDQISFKLVYRIGRQIYESPPLNTVVHFEEAEGMSPVIYIVPPLAVALIVLLGWMLRRKRWTRQRFS